MSDFTVTLPGGLVWTPQFISGLNHEKCIGCGLCFRVCGRGVLRLMAVNEGGEILEIDSDADDDDGEYERKVMTVARPQDCVGCQACARICTKKCHVHAPAVAQAN